MRKQRYDDISASQSAKQPVNYVARLLAFCCARRLGLPEHCSNSPSNFERNDLDYLLEQVFYSRITSKLSQRRAKPADLTMERSKTINPKYNIDRDQPTSWASPLGINVLLSDDHFTLRKNQIVASVIKYSKGACQSDWKRRDHTSSFRICPA